MNMLFRSGVNSITLPEPEYSEEENLKPSTKRKLSMQGIRSYLSAPRIKTLKYDFKVPNCSTVYPSYVELIQFLIDTRGTSYKIWYDVTPPPFVYDVNIVNSPVDIDIQPAWYLFTLQLERIG